MVLVVASTMKFPPSSISPLLLLVHHCAELPVVDASRPVLVELAEGGLRLLRGKVLADPLELGPVSG